MLAILEEIYALRVTLMPGAATLVATMRRHGAHCALVSGGFTFFTERIAARLSFDSASRPICSKSPTAS